MERPDSGSDAVLSSAVRALAAGDFVRADRSCRAALAKDPGHAGALAVFGAVHLALARFEEAERLFDELSRREPAQPSHWINLGTALRNLKRWDPALRAFERAAALGEESADFFYNVGVTHFERMDYESACAVLQRARERAPQDAEVRIYYARASERLLRNDEAIAALVDWHTLRGLTGDQLASIAQVLISLGEREAGDNALRAALGSPTLRAAGMLTAAQTLERVNRVAEAAGVLQRVASLKLSPPLETDALRARAQICQRHADHEGAVRLYRQVLEGCREFHLRHFQLFPLAQSLDALGRVEEAFEALLEAHASQAEYLTRAAPLSSLRGPPPMTITRYQCDPRDVASWDESGAPSASESPIFIVGFPRSGTTLLELTLDAHPHLKSMDEQPFIQNALDDIVAAGVMYPEQLARLRREDLSAIRERYFRRATAKAGLRSGERLIDKNPLNILRLPVIRRLFPHARIILALRHPCDVLLSCFMQHFRAPDFSLLCGSLGTLANAYHRTFEFWYAQAEVLRPTVHELRYESFVTQGEAQVRELCEFLQLPWDESLLSPATHANAKGFISTPSYAQVVQPVSPKAIGRWQRYERHFASVMPVLAPYLRRWQYEIPHPIGVGESL